MSVLVAQELSSVLGSRLTVGQINIGLLNRIIIDDLILNDQSGKELLKIGRLSAKFEILPLFNGKISIGNVQLFSFNANLERPTPQAETNFQFILDASLPKTPLRKRAIWTFASTHCWYVAEEYPMMFSLPEKLRESLIRSTSVCPISLPTSHWKRFKATLSMPPSSGWVLKRNTPALNWKSWALR